MKMHLVSQSVDSPSLDFDRKAGVIGNAECLETAVKLLTGVAETACEHEADLDLMRLINFIDLYRAYLARALSAAKDLSPLDVNSSSDSSLQDSDPGSTPLVGFEKFIGDSRLLAMAASFATAESGESVAVPAPLQISANADLDIDTSV